MPEPQPVADLDPAERQVVERYVILERARAVTLADPARGTAILDSLATAWGDSAGHEAELALHLRDVLLQLGRREPAQLVGLVAGHRDRVAGAGALDEGLDGQEFVHCPSVLDRQ